MAAEYVGAKRAARTAGNALAGSLAATLQAIEIAKLLAGERASLAAGSEVLFDARSHAIVSSRLVRNPACRFSHERWRVGSASGLTLREALALGGPGACLLVPDSAFVARQVCSACEHEEDVFRLRESFDARPCPRCGAARSLRGFDLVERLSEDTVPAAALDRRLEGLGLRTGEVFGVDDGDGTRHFALGLDTGVAPAPTLVLAGLGNVGSFLAPLLARLPSLSRIVLCDPDVYESTQVAGQDIEPSAVGRRKADAQAQRLRRIRPELHVEAFCEPAERLPLGFLSGAVAVSCLDSRAARLRLAARAWRVGSPFVDAAVAGGASLLARTTVYLPEGDAACFECAFDAGDYAALEQVLPCARAEAA